MRQSKNAIIKHCFPLTEPDSKRRPETVRNCSEVNVNPPIYKRLQTRRLLFLLQVVTQFKSSLVGLTEILMSKEPWYVRCIKPNEAKQPGEALQTLRMSAGVTIWSLEKKPCYGWTSCLSPAGRFDDVLVRHQVKYLGLMEHLRVRRAGFAYRRKYDIFLQR